MESITQILRDLVGHHNSLAGLGVLAGSAAIEYLFPPFPGDFVTVLGAVLVTGYGWSFFAVLGAVMLGSLVGAFGAYEVGVVWARRRAAAGRPHGPALAAVIERFHRHGSAFVIVNRFLPGIRAFIFVAAGLAGTRRRAVLFYAAVSALAWNLALMAVGAAVGSRLDRLRELVEQYTMIVWIVLAVVAAAMATRWYARRRRDRARTADPGPE